MDNVNPYIVYDREQALMEQNLLNDLKYARIGKNLEFASSELDRLIAELKTPSLGCRVRKEGKDAA